MALYLNSFKNTSYLQTQSTQKIKTHTKNKHKKNTHKKKGFRSTKTWGILPTKFYQYVGCDFDIYSGDEVAFWV